MGYAGGLTSTICGVSQTQAGIDQGTWGLPGPQLEPTSGRRALFHYLTEVMACATVYKSTFTIYRGGLRGHQPQDTLLLYVPLTKKKATHQRTAQS